MGSNGSGQRDLKTETQGHRGLGAASQKLSPVATSREEQRLGARSHMAPGSAPRPGCQHGAFLDVAVGEQRPSGPHKHHQPLPTPAASEDAGDEVTAPQPWAPGDLTGGSKRGRIPAPSAGRKQARNWRSSCASFCCRGQNASSGRGRWRGALRAPPGEPASSPLRGAPQRLGVSQTGCPAGPSALSWHSPPRCPQCPGL